METDKVREEIENAGELHYSATFGRHTLYFFKTKNEYCLTKEEFAKVEDLLEPFEFKKQGYKSYLGVRV